MDEIILGEDLPFDFDPKDADAFDLGVKDLRDQEGLEYPAVLLSGISFTDCLKVLQSRKKASYREMDIWVELPDDAGFQCVGTMQMDSDTLLILRHLQIRVTIYFDKELVETLDLNNPATLERFV